MYLLLESVTVIYYRYIFPLVNEVNKVNVINYKG